MPPSAFKHKEKNGEHNIYVAAGLLIDHVDGESRTGASAKLGYGVGYYFSEKFSVMPGLVIRQDVENPFGRTEGADEDVFSFLELPVILRFHLANNNNKCVLGLEPVFSFCLDNDTYYLDAYPGDPLGGRKKIKNFNFGIQPNIMYEIRKFRIGVEGGIGLLNMAKPYEYDIANKNMRLHQLLATFQFYF